MDVRVQEEVKVISFDVRVHPTMALSELPTDYRERALLDPRTPLPISVDETIWPQIARDLYEGFVGAAMLALKWPHDAASLCDSNDLLFKVPTAWLTERPPSLKADAWFVALSVSRTGADYLASLRRQGLLYEATIASETLSECGWTFLGYDVADKMLYSPLMNNDLGLVERKPVSDPFRGTTNEYGLFIQHETATKFSEVAAKIIRDHAPYLVIGIWGHPSNH
jgi:hypothetical protein